MKRKKNEIEMPGMAWVLRLEENELGQSGYFSARGGDGVRFCEQLSGMVNRFSTEKQAQKAALYLHRKFGIPKERITIELVAHESTASFWLGDGEWPDGISVEHYEKTGQRYLLIRQDGEEFTTDDLDDKAADALVRLFEKLNRRLRSTKPSA